MEGSRQLVDIAVQWSIAIPAIPCWSSVCVTVLHNRVELDRSMTKHSHTLSCSASISGLWFILGNLVNSREEKGSSKEKFLAIYVLPICTFSFAWDWGVGAVEEFPCGTLSRFEDLSPSHSLYLRSLFGHLFKSMWGISPLQKGKLDRRTQPGSFGHLVRERNG